MTTPDPSGPVDAGVPEASDAPRVPPRPRLRRLVRVGIAVTSSFVVAVLVVTIGSLTWLRLEYTGSPAESARSRGRDALWLGHAWVDGRKGAVDVAALAERLRGTGVRDLYVHAGPLAHDGSLDPARYPEARRMVDALHAALPGTRVQAWLGDVVGPGRLDLRDGARRDRVVASAGQAVEAGFDGVHFDLEPMPDGDRDYLDVLTRARALTHARGKVLSVAAHQIEPAGNLVALARTAGVQRTKWWSPGYFGEVASRVDQVAVMAYDTWMPTRGLFGGYVVRQTRLALDRTPPDVDLLIGLPFFHDDTVGHHEDAERVATAARAVRLGLSAEPDRRAFGVALYVDFAATDEDWAAYRSEWVR
ncbi:hypothetical protein [Yinghuangia seranimata]|uniref:hypothetical protein n=1 Tax=Yinghuangia seranimata TaxID=408067 RepID=UPI00248CA8AE|nr:hypothetical protein [Yinghuangia seranimata]MDI2126263.1 hypothetical protein [Yinghuangia seranimata]